MTKAAEGTPASNTQSDVVQIEWGIATLHPHTKRYGYVESKRKILKRNKTLTGDSAFPFDKVKYSIPTFAQQQQQQQLQQAAQQNQANEQHGFQDDDNNDDSDSDDTVVQVDSESETDGNEHFETAGESDEEELNKTKTEQPPQQQQDHPKRRFTPPPFAQWRATRTTPSPEASSQSSFSQRLWAAGTGARNLLGAFASVPHPPGARPRQPTAGPLPGASGTGRAQARPNPTPGTTGQDRTPHRTQNLDHPTPRRSSRSKKQPDRLNL